MIWHRHVAHQLSAFADGALEVGEAGKVAGHLETCGVCRAALDRHRAVADLLRQAVPVEAPADLWTAIEAALDQPAPARATVGSPRWGRVPRLAAVAAVIVGLTAGVWWMAQRPAPWDVVRLDRVVAGRVADGEWLETDAASQTTLRIGEIGRVELAPETRLQLLVASPEEHRLNLQRGRISVEISAPPRVFFVETPVSTVVDLGCAYTMEVSPEGGLLRVTQGWAALEWNGAESLVPAGASARADPLAGPGTPAFDDATEAFRQAVADFDAGRDGANALATALTEARGRDTLTLWHLLSRTQGPARAQVFDRMVDLTPLPDGVTRELALALDAGTLRHWREELAWTW